MQYDEIMANLAGRGISPSVGMFYDENYVCPSRSWVLGTFSTAFRHNLDLLRVSGYESEAWDCDDFARAAAFMAGICHVRTVGRKDSALSFGIFLFECAQGPHAIDIVITGESQDDILFYEPQTQQEINLTDKEQASCFGYAI